MMNPIDAFSLGAVALALASLAATFALHWGVRRKLTRAERACANADFTPAISVLKPLCGMDEGLYENLVSFVEQAYPEFELVFAVADASDPALHAVARLRRAYPEAAFRVIVHGERDPLANPKVLSLVHMTRAAKHDYVLVSDSNVRAAPNYLASIAAEMNDRSVGLVSNLIVGAGEDSFGAQCENLHLNTFVLGGVCLADLSEQPCVLGKSMLMRRSELTRLGGFETMRDVLAEDYLLGQRYHAAGYRVVLSCHRVATYNRRLPIRRFVSRHLRWAQLRRSCALTPFLSELLLYASPWLLLPLLAADGVGRALPFCTLGLLARIGSDAQLAKTTSGRWPAPSALLLIPLKDALLLAVWTIALLRRNVEWRGHALRIGPGSRLLPIPERSWLRDRTATSLH